MAALNMLGKCVPYGNLPVRWHKNGDQIIHFAGYSTDHDEIYIDCKEENLSSSSEFIAYYIKDEKVQAVAAQGRAKEFLTLLEAM